jgi:hypothetical protein
MRDFTKLVVWQKSHRRVLEVHRMTMDVDRVAPEAES